jgi:hypothetical protein
MKGGKLVFQVGAYKDQTVEFQYRTLSDILDSDLMRLTPLPPVLALTTDDLYFSELSLYVMS